MLNCSHDLSVYLQSYACTEVPFIYLPLGLRGKVKFRSLARHKFSDQEKAWLCDFVGENACHGKCGDIKLPDLISLTLLLGIVAFNYDLHTESLACWMELYNGKKFPVDGTGKSLIGDISWQMIALWKDKFFIPVSTFYGESDQDFLHEVACWQQAVWTQSREDWSRAILHISMM